MKKLSPTVLKMLSEVEQTYAEKVDIQKKASQSVFGFCAVSGKNIPFLTPNQLAQQLQLSLKTLERLRARGEGPPFMRTSTKHIRYPIKDLDQWVLSLLAQVKHPDPL